MNEGVSYSIDAEAGMAYVAGTVDPNTLLTSFAKAGKHAMLLRVHSDSGHHTVIDHFSTSVGNSSTGNVNRSVKPPPQDNQYRLEDGGSGYGYRSKSNQYRLVDGSSGYGYVSKSNQYKQDRSLVTKTHHHRRHHCEETPASAPLCDHK